MTSRPSRLKYLLQERHSQTYRTFCAEYDKAAESIDQSLVGTFPSRPQLHRWLSGELKGLPYPDHCRVLESMFPEWSAKELFEPCLSEGHALARSVGGSHNSASTIRTSTLLEIISRSFEHPDRLISHWGDEQSTRNTPLDDHDPTINPGDASLNLSRRLIAAGRKLRLSANELGHIAELAGYIVELETNIDIHIASDGWSSITYQHKLFNMSTRPLARLPRELWFETTLENGLAIKPSPRSDHEIYIQRVHDTGNLSKFACQLATPLQSGDVALIAYNCTGGRFVSDHYWRQSVTRYTQRFTITLTHEGADRLANYDAVLEQADGSQSSVIDNLILDSANNSVIITLAHDYLRPNDAVTLRWELDRDAAR